MTEMTAPAALAGIRVLDLSRVLAGPWSTQILADLGADVVKVEVPGRGDDTRAWGPPFLKGANGEDEIGTSAYYLAANRNKRSIAVDFASPEGAALLRQLATKADIVIENFKVGGLKKYGLDWESLRAVKPNLVYCSVTGFGQTGPYANRGGYDFVAQGMGGFMAITGEEGAVLVVAVIARRQRHAGRRRGGGRRDLPGLHHVGKPDGRADDFARHAQPRFIRSSGPARTRSLIAVKLKPQHGP